LKFDISNALPEPATHPSPMIRFDLSQEKFFRDESRVIVVNWHRQKGKDFCAAAKAVDHAMRTGQNWYLISLTQRQSDETFKKCEKFARAFQAMFKMQGNIGIGFDDFEARDKWIDQKFRFTARKITLPNGAEIVSLPGRDPDTLAGLTGNLIFTEFGLFPGGGYEHWGTVFPIATRGSFRVIVISTPRGKNTKFYEVYGDPQTYSVHTCDIRRSVEREGFVLFDTHGNPCSIETFRRIYNDEGRWPREYECQFTGDLESLIKWAQLEQAAALSQGLPFDFLRIEGESGWDAGFFRREFPSGARLEVGWDVARTGHLSPIAVNLNLGMKSPRHLRFLVIMHNASFALMRAVVIAAMDANKWRSVGAGDSTGLGMESNETLATKYRGRWEGINFAGSRKLELASTLATGFSDAMQTIPPLDGAYKFVATDLYAIQKDNSGARESVVETENALLPESHCDIGWSLALARMAGSQNALTRPPRRGAKPLGL
jgi:phage FluMu gp28-like protein